MTGLSALAGIRSSLPRGGSYGNIAIALSELEAVVDARFDGYIAGCSFGETGLSYNDAWDCFLNEKYSAAVAACKQRYGDEVLPTGGTRWEIASDLMLDAFVRDMKLRRAFQIGWQEASFARTLK